MLPGIQRSLQSRNLKTLHAHFLIPGCSDDSSGWLGVRSPEFIVSRLNGSYGNAVTEGMREDGGTVPRTISSWQSRRTKEVTASGPQAAPGQPSSLAPEPLGSRRDAGLRGRKRGLTVTRSLSSEASATPGTSRPRESASDPGPSAPGPLCPAVS